MVRCVSLFTREWIEMAVRADGCQPDSGVSLFTREWIEIQGEETARQATEVSLFTREWIEIGIVKLQWIAKDGLPLYEGVDWNI